MENNNNNIDNHADGAHPDHEAEPAGVISDAEESERQQQQPQQPPQQPNSADSIVSNNPPPFPPNNNNNTNMMLMNAPNPPPPLLPPPPNPAAALQFYHDQMQSHAAAYAHAAAQAAMAAAQAAQAAAEYASATQQQQQPWFPAAPPPPMQYGPPPMMMMPPGVVSPTNHAMGMGPGAFHDSPQQPQQHQQQPAAPQLQQNPYEQNTNNYSGDMSSDGGSGSGSYFHHNSNNHPQQHPNYYNQQHHNHQHHHTTHNHRRKKKRIPRNNASSSFHRHSYPPQYPQSQRTGSNNNSNNGNHQQPQPALTPSVFGGPRTHATPRVRRRAAAEDGNNSSSSGGPRSSNSLWSPSTYFRKKPRSDASLLGKSAVSAIHEWCSKRHTPVTFQWVTNSSTNATAASSTEAAADEGGSDDNNNNEKKVTDKPDDDTVSTITMTKQQQQHHPFVVSVLVQNQEYGIGDGSTKQAAKQLAAKRALLALVPSIVFDESGVVIELPKDDDADADHSHSRTSRAGLRRPTPLGDDDLPNLAKRLAIRHDNDPTPHMSSAKKAAKRSLDFYPATSTSVSSDNNNSHNATNSHGCFDNEEDENEYYTGRGASVCSSLLHAMVRIDPRLQATPPTFVYEQQATTQQSIKRHRASFSCTGSLQVRLVEGSDVAETTEDAAPTALDDEGKPTSELANEGDKTQGDSKEKTKHHIFTGSASAETTVLQAIGVGQSKREARHVSCAKLLALLFPECESMVAVKQAAEAKREAYLLARDQQSILSEVSDLEQPYEVTLPFPTDGAYQDPPLPKDYNQWLQQAVQPTSSTKQHDSARSEGDYESPVLGPINGGGGSKPQPTAATTQPPTSPAEPVFRQASRRDQANKQIEQALQSYNDHDDDGRSLPDELTVDDIGRTILRQAVNEDLESVVRLLLPHTPERLRTFDGECPDDQKERVQQEQALLHQLKFPSSVILLLCRAVAAFDDPPLACAVLSRGFTMRDGVHFRVEQIANESHAPKERFVECLTKFCKQMKHNLVTEEEETTTKVQVSELRSFMINQLGGGTGDAKVAAAPSQSTIASDSSKAANAKSSTPTAIHLASPLQSVAEESEVSSDGTSEKRTAKRSTKPSKRSRVV